MHEHELPSDNWEDLPPDPSLRDVGCSGPAAGTVIVPLLKGTGTFVSLTGRTVWLP